MHPEVERRARAGLPRLRLPWAAMTAAVLLLAGLGISLAGLDLPRDEPAPPVAIAIVAAGVACGAAVVALDRRILAPSRFAARVGHPDVDHVLRHLLAAHLVLWSSAEVPAILGFASLLAGGGLRGHLLLCGVSLGTMAWLMPTWARIAARVEAVVK